jgi:hypothetical protein
MTVGRKGIHLFVCVYAFSSFLELRSKLQVTPAWFDGTLDRNHAVLLAYQYANNELAHRRSPTPRGSAT